MNENKPKEQPPEDPLTYLYTKTYSCPVCGKDFMDFAVRRSRLRQISTDSDFRTRYRTIDPNNYEVLLCVNCGYAALQNFFDRITPKQQDRIKEKITPNFKPVTFKMPLTLHDAVTKYKMAYTCADAIGAKASLKAILCLRMAWIYRDLEDETSELKLIKAAYIYLKDAFMNENFPLGNMDEPTSKYMIAELARRLGEYGEALKLVSDVVVAQNIPGTLKERAVNLKDLIREATKKLEK